MVKFIIGHNAGWHFSTTLIICTMHFLEKRTGKGMNVSDHYTDDCCCSLMSALVDRPILSKADCSTFTSRCNP